MLSLITAVFIVVLLTMFPISVKHLIESKLKWKIPISILLVVGAIIIVIAIVLKRKVYV